MIEYGKLPLSDLRKIAEQEGIEIVYHPHITRITKDNRTIAIKSDLRKILEVIMTWK